MNSTKPSGQTCFTCNKTVYPLEQLIVFDKVWHKACFKCQECGVGLTLQNYKDFQKLPYCRAHLPQLKPTAVASTPEIKRATRTTKLQSNVEYHASFEKQKGRYTPVADTPEGRRARDAARLASNVVYHGDLAKKLEQDGKRSLGEEGIVKQTSPEQNLRGQTVIFTSSTGPIEPQVAPNTGSILDYDPLAEGKSNVDVGAPVGPGTAAPRGVPLERVDALKIRGTTGKAINTEGAHDFEYGNVSTDGSEPEFVSAREGSVSSPGRKSPSALDANANYETPSYVGKVATPAQTNITKTGPSAAHVSAASSIHDDP